MADSINSVTNTETSAQKLSSKKNIVSKDDFLKLLTFQMKNQNPMKPYDNQEFAAQLAQFSQLEQLIDIRSMIEETANLNKTLAETITNSALPGMLGKTARALTNEFTYDGENKVNLGFGVSSNAKSGTLIIRDANGAVVRRINLNSNELTTGNHKYVFDGTDNNGNAIPTGKYTYEVQLSNDGTTTFSADTFIEGKIDAVRFKGDSTVLVISGSEVSLGKVLDITAS
ncbi:MAG TPA: flagellar hook capping FlgD N-terminal domain-containing protein [Candidatus Kapabacteria bacterium]|nr:flagellar hook capping FlgD N-terminal domain-containing protein [Candidatus Kapabacteria bacterium]HOQ48680.1 flagellar hook capping FlgD N-terminal domain-containing protein [Candidatus Kapabacteria bacterium]HPP40452.1 flagellar hook capping FlgD N-terminal domain-containing protein [Candidatus Kapabacteria bacterium]HPU22766.1 flagellar hook capping FlgD N-terminal domain-containing protein [Candidatus Kapabacteria bacterium]